MKRLSLAGKFAPPATALPYPLPAATAMWLRIFAQFEIAFSFFAICVYCSAFLPAARFFGEDGTESGDTDPTNQACQTIILVGVAVLALVYRREILALIARVPGTFAILLLVAGSAFWSDDPTLTLRRSVVFAVTTLFGAYLTVRFDFRRISKLVAWVGLVLALSSLFLIVAMPSIGLDQFGENTGLPRGVFSSKNVLGSIMTLCSIFAFWTALRERNSPLYWGSWGACILLAVLSRSATTTVALTAVYGAWLACSAYRHAPRYGLFVLYAAFVPLVFLACAVLLFPENFASLLGKDPTLSGRDVLWAAVWDFIQQRPLLGYGYGAFWRDASVEAHQIWTMLGWNPPHAHNAVLEILLELGGFGLIWVSLYYGGIWWRLLSALLAGDMPEATPLLAAMIAFLVQGFSEGNLLHQGDVDWVLVMVVVVTLARHQDQRRAEPVAPVRRASLAPLRSQR